MAVAFPHRAGVLPCPDHRSALPWSHEAFASNRKVRDSRQPPLSPSCSPGIAGCAVSQPSGWAAPTVTANKLEDAQGQAARGRNEGSHRGRSARFGAPPPCRGMIKMRRETARPATAPSTILFLRDPSSECLAPSEFSATRFTKINRSASAEKAEYTHVLDRHRSRSRTSTLVGPRSPDGYGRIA